ncbi:MAG TPA: 5'-nucleotidase C-terminal domain-containing protein [Bacteroidales bacterium]|nr:5'-nucleotidase C-terminal domain-containing protein [Bacteroidales bacterium]HPS27139.1 5'-nucleotidase C-terminal domain-containing protein [Bacteroidales bacterium]
MTNRQWILFSLIFCGIILSSCSSYYQLKKDKTQVSAIRIDTINVPDEDSTFVKLIAPYKVQLDGEMNEVLAYSDMAMKKSLPEGLLNNFVADLTLTMGNRYLKKLGKDTASVCLLNSGGLRSDLPMGAVTLRNVFELMPFENEMVAVSINGSNAEKMFGFIAYKGGMPMAGATLGIGADTVSKIIIGKAVFDKSKNYTVITSDYLALGGDEMSFFASPVVYLPLKIKIRDAIIDYLREQTAKGKTITAQLDKRIYYEK